MKSFLLAVACLFPAFAFGAVPTTSVDIGQVAAAGSTSTANGVYTVRASGADIWGTQDEFRFVHAQLSGDGEITARVDSLTATDPWTKAGVMIRETLNANSRFAYTLVSAGNGVSFQHRLLAGGSAVQPVDARRGLARAVLGAVTPNRQRVHGVRLGQRTSLATARQQRHDRNGHHRIRGPRRDEPSRRVARDGRVLERELQRGRYDAAAHQPTSDDHRHTAVRLRRSMSHTPSRRPRRIPTAIR